MGQGIENNLRFNNGAKNQIVAEEIGKIIRSCPRGLIKIAWPECSQAKIAIVAATAEGFITGQF